MKRWLGAFIIIVLESTALAQEPQITVEPAQEEVVVGQPYIVRVKVLVPSFMPTPPVFPTFEVPGLIVRLPERSTQPISERVDGETWAGVQRTFRIYPMQAGVTEVPVQSITVTYKDTGTNEDVSVTTEVPATQIVATVPDAARGLDPLIIADDVKIAQSWQVADGELSIGDAITRRLEISVTGASALFVPPLLKEFSPAEGNSASDPPVAGFLDYPEDGVVTEKFDRGVMSGTRSEEVSYIAQGGGAAEFPGIVLDWFNVKSGRVETITLEGRSVEVAMPPAVRQHIDREAARRKAVALAFVLTLGWMAYRFLWPLLPPRIEVAKAQYRASAFAAHKLAEREATAGNLGGVLAALDQRKARGHEVNPALNQALKALTRARYRENSSAEAEWQALRNALRCDRPRLFGGDKHAEDLPRLNPFL